MPYKRDKCKRCKRRGNGAGYISKRGLCGDCAVERMTEQNELARKGLQQFVRGRHRLAAAVRRDGGGSGGR